MRRLIALVVLAGCASMAPIPGGPEDHTPPKLLTVTPDTNSVNFHGSAVSFRFDEVVNDRSGPTSDLNGLFLISPRDGDPRIHWHRSRIDVQPHNGKWLPNTAYAVTLLPGLGDLSGNAMKQRYTVVFTTGPVMPAFGIHGRVFDWMAQKEAPGAVVQAIQRPDSVVFFAVADSTGQFDVGPLAAGTYSVIAFVDPNHNLTRDASEIWDSTQVKITNTQPYLELLAARRDTVGPVIASVDEADSVTVRVTFDKPLDPAALVDTTHFALVTGDSVRLTLVAARTLARYDADRAKARADSARVADSLAALRDTTHKVAPKPPVPAPAAADTTPKPSRPAPATVVMLDLALGSKLPAGKPVRVTASDIRNLLGFAAKSTRVFVTPKPVAPADSSHAKASADTSHARVRPDTGVLLLPLVRPPHRQP